MEHPSPTAQPDNHSVLKPSYMLGTFVIFCVKVNLEEAVIPAKPAPDNSSTP